MAQVRPKFLPRIESPSRNGSGSGAVAAGGATNFAVGGGNPFEENEETPIFSKRKMLLRIPSTYAGNFVHLTVSKNWLVCLLATSEHTTMFLRFFLPRAIPPGEIALEKYLAGYKITKLFLDPTGHHLLISLVPRTPGLSADFLYVHGSGPKVRRIEKFKDHEITAVAFNNELGTESTTGAILLGTSRGLIFETELLQDADKPSYRKQLYDLGLGRTKYPITGLALLRVPETNRYVVIAVTHDCIYTFQETLKPEERTIQGVFSSYVNGSREPLTEEHKTDLNCSLFSFYAPPRQKYPTKWAWLCSAGIRVGEVAKDGGNGTATLLGDTLISLDFEQLKSLNYEERRSNLPKAFVITEYHALVMYSDHVSGISLLNQELVYEEYFKEKLQNILRDAFTGEIYLYTDKSIYNFKIDNETRNVWRIYLDKAQYDLAEVHAAEDPEHLDIVLTRRAEAAYEAGDHQEAANIFADTRRTFEEVCLQFMPLDDKRPIITYVLKRLNKLTETAENAPRIKVLVLWLVNLYITQINLPERDAKWRAQWQAEYDAFMRDPKVARCTQEHRTIVQQLITQHADPHNLAQFAIANGDYEEVINQQLNAENYTEALQTLRTQKQPELFYKYTPILIEQLPQETVDVLTAQGHKLAVEKLVPALIVTESAKHVEQIIRYLEFAVYTMGTTNEAIHNFLLRLYAEHNPDMLNKYLQTQGRDRSLVHYDLHTALRVCTDFGVHEACVFVKCLLEQWESAVELALSFNVSLAKKTASRPSSEETRRDLWLRIAHHEIQGTDDVKKALNLLKECDLLRIEDLLPFFSDFEKIDNFKEPICEALKEYNQKIQELQHDMTECSKQAKHVREELQNLRHHSIRIEAHESCSSCESFLLIKPFFAFNCGHKFHSDCLEKLVVPTLSSDRSRQLTMLKQQLETFLTMTDQTQEQQSKRVQLKTKIEDLLAADCPYCGLLIETIDQPFVDDWDQVNVDWE